MSSRTTAPPAWRPRSEIELLVDQVAGIEAWHARRRQREQAEPRTDERNRERRLDAARHADVVARQHRALVARTEQHLRGSGNLLAAVAAPRAVLVHRDAWFLDRVCGVLRDREVEVAAAVENGADAVGVVAAEQPDLLLVQERLPMLSGAELLRQALPLSPRTAAVGHVEGDAAVAELLEAGARAAYTRRVRPAEVAEGLLGLLA